MADQHSGSLPPELGGLQAQSLKKILSNTISTIENNKSQIFEIYETARSEVESSRKLLTDLKEQARQTIERVDELAKKEQQEKQRLVKVSSNFQNYSEEKVRESYEAVKNVQVSLGVEREKEANLRAQRDKLEIRLRNLQTMLAQAEHLALAVGSVLSYLSTQVNGVIWKIEAVQKEKFIGARIIKAQEEERYRISREIHDGPAQDLANLIFQASIAEKLVDYDPDEAKRTLQELRQQMRDCLGSVREVIFDMRPMALDDLGLVAALNQLIGRMASRGMLAVDFSLDGTVYELPKHVEIAIFRIVQEALNNIRNHAETDMARVRVLFSPVAVSILIEDNGKGFDPEAKPEALDEDGEPLPEELAEVHHHFGLTGMRERAKIIGAELSITSAVGEGTRVHLRVPNREPQMDTKDVKVVNTPNKKGRGK
ncbi:putative sensor histidine kinase DegS [Selenomonas ruminantium subsp. lactilytica TAM6421]|uniref:histidine kinase n=1 Tax=Selenomonas ruminantium subsp. lactilytica (strain NBRC 103574 / TAM6421) TaxID=927704 RepID=I0GN69_SELRL|nr:sensor histidine kinase [Selenomonas ruminantium]BAL82206.1 putative sensor histidine kinase DegS [Selenomonas ruminantium subsp. lactilytica TAM6421]